MPSPGPSTEPGVEASSVPPGSGSFRQHLEGALRSLESEMPRLYARMAACLCGREVELEVGGQVVRIDFGSAGGPFGSSAAPAAALCRTSRRTIVEVAEGRLSLEDAIWSERIFLLGGLDDLLAFHDALLVFLHGAVRSPSFGARLRSFKRGIPEESPDAQQ